MRVECEDFGGNSTTRRALWTCVPDYQEFVTGPLLKWKVWVIPSDRQTPDKGGNNDDRWHQYDDVLSSQLCDSSRNLKITNRNQWDTPELETREIVSLETSWRIVGLGTPWGTVALETSTNFIIANQPRDLRRQQWATCGQRRFVAAKLLQSW